MYYFISACQPVIQQLKLAKDGVKQKFKQQNDDMKGLI